MERACRHRNLVGANGQAQGLDNRINEMRIAMSITESGFGDMETRSP